VIISLPGLGRLLRKPKKEEKASDSKTPEATEPETKETPGKTYLKAMPLRELSDLESIKAEVKSGNILILRITTLANKNVDDVKQAVTELTEFTESIGGDIARLGEERVVICPANIKIWREKTSVPNQPMPTAA
jgi:SepF-like predicted cell division protein (DUF552 family)